MASRKTEKAGQTKGQLRDVPVAIIGLSAIFPMARNTQEYWDNILHKIDCVVDVPASRWSIDDYYDPDPSAPDKTYCKRGGFIPDIDFDPMEFGLPPNILEVTDVSQLLGLVAAREALEDAGYGEEREFARETTGVVLGFVGMGSKLFTPLMSRLQYPVWEKVLKSAGVSDADTQRIIEKIKLGYVGWEENSFPGTIGNVISGRIANRFNLGGTNFVTDAACGSSLAAIRAALSELSTYRADMMISGGVDTDNSIGTYLCFSKTPAFSHGENVRTFDAETSGMMVGEGLGMLVLKRLEDAERDSDRIYAVIRGAGSSSDGRFKSIYAPRPSGQALAVRRAYEEAGFTPDTVGLIEAHGTGTPAGDPAEFSGLREVFEPYNPEKQGIAIGSIKSQISHTKAAAGTAGMIKVALALHNKVLPPTINVTKPNPKMDVANSPFYINTEARPWIPAKPGMPRRAGVSAFGFGGTNFHIVLEEYRSEQEGAYRSNQVAQPVLLAAETPGKLLAAAQDTLAKLSGADGAAYFNQLSETSRSLSPAVNEARVGFVAMEAAEAQELLQAAISALKDRPDEEAWEHPKGIYYRKSGLDTQGKVVAMFSGQGSQYVEMGKDLAMNFPPVREVFQAVDRLFVQDGLQPLSGRVYPRPVFSKEEQDELKAALTRTEHAQPAIGAMSVSLFKLLQQAGFQANFTAGHSFGEWTALWAAGVLDDETYYHLAKARGQAMAAPEDPNFDAGTMLAVKGDADKVKEAIQDFPEITLANYNAKNQVVLAGSKAAVAEVQKALAEKGYSVIPLPVSAAFHTSLVGHAQKPFAEAIFAARFKKPKLRVFSNGAGKEHDQDPKQIQERMAGHILSPVRWTEEIEAIYAEGGRVFVEFGPKSVLTNLVKNILEGQPHVAVALNANPKKDSDRQLREAVVQLRVAGVALSGFDPYELRKAARPGRKMSPVTVKLNGGYYVSEKTRKAFEDALQDGFKIQQALAKPAPMVTPAANPTPAPVQAAVKPVQAQAAPQPAATYAAVPAQGLTQFQAQQSETAHIHGQYLQNEQSYVQAFTQLTQSSLNLLANGNLNAGQFEQLVTVLQGLERSMEQFHAHQAETLRVHEQYLKGQESFAQSFARLLEQRGVSSNGNGHTPAVEAARPDLSPVYPMVEEPAIWDLAANGNGNGKRSAPEPKPVMVAAPTAPAPITAAPVVTAPVVQATPASDLTEVFLEIVSEKTGYPTEMLELDMDMEADLGINSIKRVEILSAVREQQPNLPKLAPEAFAELRTLRQIIAAYSAPVGTRRRRSCARPIPNAGPNRPRTGHRCSIDDRSDWRYEGRFPDGGQRQDRLPNRNAGAGHGHGGGPGDQLDQAGRNPWRGARAKSEPAQAGSGGVCRAAHPAPDHRSLQHAGGTWRRRSCTSPIHRIDTGRRGSGPICRSRACACPTGNSAGWGAVLGCVPGCGQ